MALKLMYITNDPTVALAAEAAGTDMVWVDLETLGKAERQGNMDSVKSHHTVEDIRAIRKVLTRAELLVRVDPIHDGSAEQIERVIDAGADIIMLPMWKSREEVVRFLSLVNGRCRTMLLLETREADECLDEVLQLPGVDMVHIGLNDLHLSYKRTFMFELLADGTVERICERLRAAGKPYGFGGVGRIGTGLLPAEHILGEHIRLGSQMAILSRSFCDVTKVAEHEKIAELFDTGLRKLRACEDAWRQASAEELETNRRMVCQEVSSIAAAMKQGGKSMLTFQELKALSKKYGPSFYLLDTAAFRRNYQDLLQAFRAHYPKTSIAYSYKTDYIPRLCEIVSELGGYAEIVSDMEYAITKRLGIPAERVVFNGPYKDAAAMEEIILRGGIVNLDSLRDLNIVKEIAARHAQQKLAVGLRCNFDVHDGAISRFGFDVDGKDFLIALDYLRSAPNMRLKGLHCHFASRSLPTWPERAAGMLRLAERLGVADTVEYIDLGGGLFGRMPESLRCQFDTEIPSFKAYADAAARPFAEFYAHRTHQPWLMIEPGSALAGDVMKFASPVVSIKEVRGKEIATLLGSIYNINPTLNKKNPPLEVFSLGQAVMRHDLDFGGFTCIESDYLYRHYQGPLQEGDYVVFGNAGSYSVVLKPPFILPNFPVLERMEDGSVREVKRAETFEDLFRTYSFDFG